LTLVGIAHIAGNEFTTAERKGLLQALNWPEWHYYVILLYGQNIALNIALTQNSSLSARFSIIQFSSREDYRFGCRDSQIRVRKKQLKHQLHSPGFGFKREERDEYELRVHYYWSKRAKLCEQYCENLQRLSNHTLKQTRVYSRQMSTILTDFSP
jgi:hypothetical protein